MLITVNSIQLYYEVLGAGQPIILLHGNGEDHHIFDELTDLLRKSYTVYALDSRCHGKSEDSATISYEQMADDIIAFIKALHLEKPILYGFSDGGIIGLLIAMKEPELLSALIASGANIEPSGLEETMLRDTRREYRITQNKLLKMILCEPHIAPEDLKKITVPTYILAGENDIVRREHTELIARCIPGSVLKIIENEGHGSYIVHNPKLYEILQDIL